MKKESKLVEISWDDRNNKFVDNNGREVIATPVYEPFINITDSKDIWDKEKRLKEINRAGLARGANAYCKGVIQCSEGNVHAPIQYYNILRAEKK